MLRLYDQTEAARNFSIQDRCLLIVLDEGDPALIDAVMAVVAEECRAITGAEDLDPEVVDKWLTHRNDVSALETTIRRGIVVDRHKVDLEEPLRSLGTYKVAVRVYQGMSPEVTIIVEPKG